MALNNNFQNIDLSQLKEWVEVDKVCATHKESERTSQYVYVKNGYTVFYSDSFSYESLTSQPTSSDSGYPTSNNNSGSLKFLLNNWKEKTFQSKSEFENTIRGKYFYYSYSISTNEQGYCSSYIMYMPSTSKVTGQSGDAFIIDKITYLENPNFIYKAYDSIFANKRPESKDQDKTYIIKPTCTFGQYLFKPEIGDYLVKDGKIDTPYGYRGWMTTDNNYCHVYPILPKNATGYSIFGRWYSFACPSAYYPPLDLSDLVGKYIKITAKLVTTETSSNSPANWQLSRVVGTRTIFSNTSYLATTESFYSTSTNSGNRNESVTLYMPITWNQISFYFYYSGPKSNTIGGWYIYNIQIVENEGD